VSLDDAFGLCLARSHNSDDPTPEKSLACFHDNALSLDVYLVHRNKKLMVSTESQVDQKSQI
jgi:hypothetical protein